jgi:hypothetical protein
LILSAFTFSSFPSCAAVSSTRLCFWPRRLLLLKARHPYPWSDEPSLFPCVGHCLVEPDKCGFHVVRTVGCRGCTLLNILHNLFFFAFLGS